MQFNNTLHCSGVKECCGTSIAFKWSSQQSCTPSFSVEQLLDPKRAFSVNKTTFVLITVRWQVLRLCRFLEDSRTGPICSKSSVIWHMQELTGGAPSPAPALVNSHQLQIKTVNNKGLLYLHSMQFWEVKGLDGVDVKRMFPIERGSRTRGHILRIKGGTFRMEMRRIFTRMFYNLAKIQ